MNTSSKLTVLFITIFVFGYFLSSLLYAHKNKKFNGSMLQRKVFMWLPIFFVFLLYINTGLISQLVVTGIVITGIMLDLFSKINKSSTKFLLTTYALLVSLGILCALQIVDQNNNLLIAVVFSSVMSDVFAFFFGNYIGRHKLPKALNSRKSWEGVLGQLVGALFGILLVNMFVTNVPIAWFIVIGAASATGDLLNSYIKRKEGFKDWSNRIPGHGGYLDRFSSLSLVLIAAFMISSFAYA